MPLPPPVVAASPPLPLLPSRLRRSVADPFCLALPSAAAALEELLGPETWAQCQGGDLLAAQPAPVYGAVAPAQLWFPPSLNSLLAPVVPPTLAVPHALPRGQPRRGAGAAAPPIEAQLMALRLLEPQEDAGAAGGEEGALPPPLSPALLAAVEAERLVMEDEAARREEEEAARAAARRAGRAEARGRGREGRRQGAEGGAAASQVQVDPALLVVPPPGLGIQAEAAAAAALVVAEALPERSLLMEAATAAALAGRLPATQPLFPLDALHSQEQDFVDGGAEDEGPAAAGRGGRRGRGRGRGRGGGRRGRGAPGGAARGGAPPPPAPAAQGNGGTGMGRGARRQRGGGRGGPVP